MNSLFFNFCRRAIVFPLIVVAVVCFVINFGASRQIEATKNIGVSKTQEVNIDAYSPKEYNKFDELKPGRYAMTLSTNRINSAVLFDNVDDQSDISNLFYLHSSSTEPWDNGCVKVISDSWYQINRLLDIRVGDEIEGDFYHSDDENETDNSVYTYKVSEILNSTSAKAIEKFNQPDTLLVCASYENYAEKNQKTYYVIVAQQEVK